ncbi:unnamed protein product [Xylocopa violacea]|uniref:28S ribosomal protein S9, mitochondrial n=1 Tax=Xylocopa violacea TaxID=135666 RepID=A0ABP1PAG2_XYLVO
MAVSMVTRFVKDVISKPYCTKFIDHNNMKSIPLVSQKKTRNKLNKAVAAYMQRSKDYKQFIENQIAEYNIGKRHLANMMGEDPDKFTQADINRSIRYLFPSGLYDKDARPVMLHPDKLYASKKEAEFDETGRPYHYLFYTTKPNFYEILHNIAGSCNYLNELEDKKLESRMLPTPQDKIDFTGLKWISKRALENATLEKLTDADYTYFIKSIDRLRDHPFSCHVASFIMKYASKLVDISSNAKIPEPEYDENKRPFILVDKCMRKSSRGTVKVIGNGSGKITINGQDITYFEDIQCREQIIFPLIFTNMCDKVDVEATVNGGGPTGQAGVIRWGIAMALRSFIDVEMVEKMRLAGLLTYDWRRRERKKWGQEGARRKFTWKKR